MSKPILVFYGRQLYGEYDSIPRPLDFPDGVYIYYKHDQRDCKQWYRADLTPCLLEDVPVETRLLALLHT